MMVERRVIDIIPECLQAGIPLKYLHQEEKRKKQDHREMGKHQHDP